jgi:ketosteroid isomerase-like protein
MAGSENEAAARAAYDAMLTRDLDRIGEVIADDAEYRNPPTAIEPGVRRGRQEFLAALGRLLDLFDYAEFGPQRVESAGELLAVELRVRASGSESGAPIDETFGHLLEFRDGKLVSLQWWSSPDEAFAALRERAAADGAG